MNNASLVSGIHVDVEDLTRVRGQISELTLASIQRQSSHRSGAREARIRGRGMEYEETRAYVSGDDVRTMDWRVMARTGEPHTKIFSEERERNHLFAVDLSASMYFGTRYSFKSWCAAYTTAHIGWLAKLSGGRIGGLVASPLAHQEIRPDKTRSGLMGLFHALAESSKIELPTTQSNSRFNFLLREIIRVAKPGSIISLVSDFIGLDDESAELLSVVNRHSDVQLFWIHDDVEIEPWQPGLYQLLIEQSSIKLNMNRSSASWLAEWQQHHRDQIESLSTRFNLALHAISCNREITPQILTQLNTRL